MIRSALVILSGNSFGALLLLLRNLIVARMITVEDFGIAATFAVTMAVVEMASALGLQQQIVQAKEGDDPHFQAALQGFQVLRGIVSGAALLLIAGPMARFMGVPEVIWAYQLLAVTPVVSALRHFDIHRMNRQMVFWPMMLTGVMPALVSVLIIWPLAYWLGDWRVMLYSILAQSVVGTVVSHLLAQRIYRMVIDLGIIRQSLRFGWPLLVNAVLLFLVFNAERLIVGRELGMAPLAIFSMGLTLTLAPTLIMAKSAMNLFLPLLSAAEGETRFDFLASVTFQLHILFGGMMALGVALLGSGLIHVLLGPKYADLVPMLTWLGIMQGVRVFKGGASTVALARGQTGNALIANVLRVALLPLAWWAVARGSDITALLYLGILGEALGALVAFTLVWRRLKIAPDRFAPTLAFTLVSVVLIGLDRVYPMLSWPLWAAGAALLSAIALSGDLRRFILHEKRHDRPM